MPTIPEPLSPSRHSGRRVTAIGLTTVILGAVLVLYSIGFAGFVSRFGGTVETTGTVAKGVAVTASGTAAAPPGNYDGKGVFLVNYRTDGIDHVGYIIGNFHTGQKLRVKAPADGSYKTALHVADAIPTKVLSWVTVLAGLPMIAFGTWWLAVGLLRRHRYLRDSARAEYGLPPVADVRARQRMADARCEARRAAEAAAASRLAEDPSRPVSGAGGQDAGQSRPGAPDGFFTRPYDI